MDATMHESLSLSGEELEMLAELLDSARNKLLVEIRRTDHREFRDELRHKLVVIEGILERCHVS